MGFGLKPKDEAFYEFLTEVTQMIRKSAEHLQAAIDQPDDMTAYAEKISKLEKDADEVLSKILGKLNKTFITPIDREDIYTLAHRLDDVVDGIYGVIDRMVLYNAGTPLEGVKELVELLVKCTKQLDKACENLKSIKKHRLKIEARCDRISELEAEADRVYRREVANLFKECSNPIEIIKWKEILEKLEDVLDVCKDVSDLLKGVVLKYA